ncbi:hypothetical protein BH23GEM7_BH23GEM7_11800 [soil metagenome]|nr:serine/threonine-protein phosphatase [Gemmatimonadota bacterium]
MNPFEREDRPIHLTVSVHSDPGRRRVENQDSYLVADLSRSAAEEGVLLSRAISTSERTQSGSFIVGPKGALLLVADGMGGTKGGAIASRIAALTIHEEMVTRWCGDRNHSPRQFAARLLEAVEQSNARILEEALRNPQYQGMGTTATVVGVLDGFLYLGQVGDSRAYLVRRGKAIQITRDQSLVQALVDSEVLTEEEAERSEQRNLVLQALGAQPEVKIDLTYQELRRGDVVLICSDGLSGLVPRDELAHTVAQSPDLTAVGGELIGLANERGGPDNITVLLAQVDGVGLDEPRDQDAVGRQVYTIPSY